MVENRRIEEDEIDLRELFKTLLKNKIFIIVFTTLLTVCAIIYAFSKKENVIYKGSDVYEIGNYISNKGNVYPLFNLYNIKNILEARFNIKPQKHVEVSIPSGTSRILFLSIIKNNKNEIKNISKEIEEFILKKHQSKVNFLNQQSLKISETILISSKIIDISIEPKRKLIVIVAFVTGFILSIFLVFFLEFIRNFKEEEKTKND